MSRVLFVLTSHNQLGTTGRPTGFHLAEMTHVYKELSEAGFEISFASVLGGKAPMDAMEMDDAINRAFMHDDARRRQIEETVPLAEVSLQEIEAVYVPGGHGTMWDMPDNERLASMIAEVYQRGGVVGAVCHGPAALRDVRLADGRYLLEGKEFACFSNAEEEHIGLNQTVPFLLQTALEARGGLYRHAGLFEPCVAVSERLVTGQNPASAHGVGAAMLALLLQLREQRVA